MAPEQVAAPGGVFLLDGKPMCFLGSNNYYLIFKSQKMVDDVLDTAKSMGLRVFRHWAFTDRGSLDGTVPAVDGDGTKEGYYFQYWDKEAGRPAYNDSEKGLEKLDYLLYKARQNDIRIVMVLTNNWRDFGGMDQYLAWYGLTKHHEFYTDERVKQAYKDYVTHLVNRVNKFTGVAYKDDPYIFAWNLANEPRMRNYGPLDDLEGWKPDTVTVWAREMSDYIRSIDPNHMISVGDEGFYANRGSAMYSGEDGVNHDSLVALPNVDYGTISPLSRPLGPRPSVGRSMDRRPHRPGSQGRQTYGARRIQRRRETQRRYPRDSLRGERPRARWRVGTTLWL